MKRPVLYGSVASVLLLITYLGILTAVESFAHALQQFAEFSYLMVPLVIGFGVQIGLYSHIREGFKIKAAATGSVAASGGVSAGSMILCCVHHVIDVLPVIGLSAAALFLSQYQVFFLVLGILSNAVGIIMMFNIMQKHGLYPKKGIFSGVFRYDLLRARNRAIFASGIILAGLFVFTAFSAPPSSGQMTGNVNPGNSGKIDLKTLFNSEAGVSVDAKPVDFEFGKEVVFEIGLNTHSESLDFDVAEIAVLRDGNGNVYNPLGWEGSPSGGHHRSGELSFPAVSESNYMELTLKGIYGIPERTFKWELGG
jgi:hypothetical protein